MLHVDSITELWWVIFGLLAQLMFTGRFIVQWIASERQRDSVVPLAFWYFSLAGGLMLFSYAVYRKDPVFILGQSLGVFIYSRNLWLIYAKRRREA
ncbi:MAG: lipid-A-disaccharide synthase N-terminal domain-containing protein [Thioclava marina]|nr:lipid-A-disaccharide synthase N-terminal domain-containing protein [Thioclava marina]MBD3803340.1 lipid-A-disaccharide synthase N-terminal domain-containing protein [Thioclava sp.]OOY12269.1 lipid A biosynthesis protein [Thioclava marina]OOY27905.1 lipid A biosynthesis protein [Thioclava sp. L04-15]